MRGQELFEIFAKNAKAAGANAAHARDVTKHHGTALVHWYQLSEEAKAAWERTATQLNEIGGPRMQQFDGQRVLMAVETDWRNHDTGQNPAKKITVSPLDRMTSK